MLSEMWTLQPPFFLTKKLFNIGVYEEEVRLKKNTPNRSWKNTVDTAYCS